MSATSSEGYSIQHQVSVASRMLALEGYADLTLGHVSIRPPGSDTIFIKRKGPALHEVEPEHVVRHHLDDDESIRTRNDLHFETPLHTEVYKLRSDVGAVIHSHPPFATALGSTHAKLEMLSHDAMLFAEHGVPGIEDYNLITEPNQGRVIAEALGGARALLLRGHGVLIVGEDIRWAVRAAIALERAIRIQMIATNLGDLRPVPTEAAREFFPRKYQARQFMPGRDLESEGDYTSLDEYWAFWTRTVRAMDGTTPPQVGH